MSDDINNQDQIKVTCNVSWCSRLQTDEILVVLYWHVDKND